MEGSAGFPIGIGAVEGERGSVAALAARNRSACGGSRCADAAYPAQLVVSDAAAQEDVRRRSTAAVQDEETQRRVNAVGRAQEVRNVGPASVSQKHNRRGAAVGPPVACVEKGRVDFLSDADARTGRRPAHVTQ